VNRGRLEAWARVLKADVLALWCALRHPQTPWYARLLAFVVTAYALSPIDLIPDFIPVLGYLDELVLLPLGIWLFLKLVPESVLADSRAEAARWLAEGRDRPRSRLGLLLVLAAWGIAAGALAGFLAF
jgi:uncharacterized membrane protein YkvA (DUF1232 family)